MWKPIISVFLCAQEPGLGLTGGVLEAWSPTVGARGEKCLSNDRGDLNSAGSQTSLSSRRLQSSEL